MKKKLFRIKLFANAKNAAEAVVLIAAKVNAGASKATLKDLKSLGEGLCQTSPEINPPTTFEMLDENTLCIDTKINGAYEPAAIIEEVEIWEIVEPKEEDDLNGLFTSENEKEGVI